jgi:hypothetical protein
LLIFIYHHKTPINIGAFAFELCSPLVYLSGKKGKQYQKAVSNSPTPAARFPKTLNTKIRQKSISNSNAATLRLGNGWSFGNGAGHFDFKRFNDNAHVLTRIILIEMLFHLRLYVVLPEIQNLLLVADKISQNVPDVVSAVQNLFGFTGRQRQTFDNGKFQARFRSPVANGRDFRQIKAMPPFRAVVGLDGSPKRKQRGSKSLVPDGRQITFKVVNHAAGVFELLHLF